MSSRDRLIHAIKKKIGRRNLVFVGIRGHDAAPLLPISQFQDCFAVAAPLGAGSLRTDSTLEDTLGHRLDLDTYDYDEDGSSELKAFRAELLRRLREPCVVATYRPSHFLWSAGFASLPSASVLGMFKDRQAAYEYKPWVEQEIARLGLRTVPWRYVADEARQFEASAFERPVVMRASRMAGGAGVALATSPADIGNLWPAASDHLVAVGPYLTNALPINVGACVYSPTEIVLHPGSIQLIGIDGVTTRPFGYCGNDFAAFAELDGALIDEIDHATRLVGHWLGKDGYRGAFGLDFMWHKGDLYFSEINPRLQGSTSLSSSMSASADVPDIVLDHVAATLGLNPTAALTLRDWAREITAGSHVVAHNVSRHRLRLTDPEALVELALLGWDMQLLPESRTRVAPGAILSRLVGSGSVTANGFSVTPAMKHAIDALHRAFDKG